MQYLHPVFVHFPIAFYLLETYLLFFLVFKKREAYRDFAYLVFKMAYISMGFAFVSGMLTAGGLDNALEHAKAHFLSALAVMVVSTARFVIWRSSLSKNQNLLLISGIILSILVMVTGYFGGELVYS